MEIKRAESCHIPGMLELLKQVGGVHHDIRPDIFREGAQKYDTQALEAILRDPLLPIFVAVEGNFVAGYCFCILEEVKDNPVLRDVKSLYIDDLCVDENIRGKHVGSKLYDYVCGYAKEIGCYNVTLNVWACNPGALKFYEKCGMQVQKMGMETVL